MTLLQCGAGSSAGGSARNQRGWSESGRNFTDDKKYTPQLTSKLGLTFPVLSDPGSKFLNQLGLVFELETAMVAIYKEFGIDLERFNGEDLWRLPLPGRIIVDKNGIVKDVELSTDHTEDLSRSKRLRF